jgi:hypothetical protein
LVVAAGAGLGDRSASPRQLARIKNWLPKMRNFIVSKSSAQRQIVTDFFRSSLVKRCVMDSAGPGQIYQHC